MKTLLAVLAAVLLVAPLGIILLFAGGLLAPHTATLDLNTRCAGTGEVAVGEVALDAAQVERAALIYRVALEEGLGPQAAIIAIAAAMQESGLGADPAAMAGPNKDGDVGLFQQRSLPGWYADGATQAENLQILADDRHQARNFFTGHTTLAGWHIPGLKDIDGWQTMTLTQAAQAAQVSAHPDAYAKHEPLARALVARFENQPPGEMLCGSIDPALDCPATGLAAEAGQTPDALRVLRCTHARWPQVTLLGVRPGDPRDHGTGRAVDIMIPNYPTPSGIELGTQIAEWARANATDLGVTYVIWREHLWSAARAGEGWRRCGQAASCYTGPDPSAAHLDHVHISVHGNASTPLTSASGGVVLPLANYRLTARFGQTGPYWANRHTGLDFAAPTGTPLKAITAGTITAVTRTGPYGQRTILTTTNGTTITYAHQSRILVTSGQQVVAGEIIGAVGATGNVSGAHLHLEVQANGTLVDPLVWLRDQGLNP